MLSVVGLDLSMAEASALRSKALEIEILISTLPFITASAISEIRATVAYCDAILGAAGILSERGC